MQPYLELVEKILTYGRPRQGQKSEGTLAIFGAQCRYDLTDGFPLITTRDMRRSWKAIVGELLWIMSGSTNTDDLHQHGTKLWDQWGEASDKKLDMGYPPHELGHHYGYQLRNFAGSVDQLTQVELMLQRDLQTRRAMISLWNLGDVEDLNGRHKVDVAPCISLLHFACINYPTTDGGEENRLDLHMFQRSADVPVGVPFDIAEWGGLFLMLMAAKVGLKPGSFIHTLSDAHIYQNQTPFMKELLNRPPLQRPRVEIRNSTIPLDQHTPDDFLLTEYFPHPPIKGIPVVD